MAGALEIRGIKYVVSGDNASVDAANARTAESMRRLDRQVEQTKIQFLSFGKQGEVTARQMQALGYQTTDIITQLASGQATWLVLLQQGGQLRDQFGGFTNVFKAVAGALTLGRVAAFGATGAFVGLAAALTLGYNESAEFRKQMALSGNAAGLTAGRVDELADSLAKLTGNTKGNAREAVMQLAQGGFTAAGALDSAGRAALSLQRISGESIDDITKRFATAREGVVRWAVEANRSYNYITTAQIEYIRSLEQQGRVQEAMRVNFDALAQVMEQRQAPALGLLEKAWQGVKNAASGAWDAIKAVGRDDTLEQQLAKVQAQIARRTGPNAGFGAGALASLRDQEANIQEQIRLQRRGAETAAAEAAAGQREIEDASKAHQDALLRIAEAGASKYLAQRQGQLDALARLEEDRYARGQSTPGQYSAGIAGVERGRLAAEEQQIRARIDIERQRKVEGSPAEIKQQEISRTVALIGFETQLVALAAKRSKLESDIRNYRVAVPPERQLSADAQLVQQLETQAYEQQARRDQDIINDRLKAQRELVEQTAEINLSLIRDDEARGRAVIRVDAEHMRARMALWALSAQEREQRQDELAAYVLARERQLTEQLKPEWQRRLDLYADTTRHMQASFNTLMESANSSAEDAWVDIVARGELSAKRLVQVINEQLARIGWQKYLAKPASDAFEGIFRSLLGLGGGGGFGTGSGYGNQDMALFFHGGGVVGQGGTARAVNPMVFAGARRYHGGGLAGNEVPAILQKGEEVLTRGDARHRANGGGQPMVQQINHFHVPAGQSPAAYAAALNGLRRELKAEVYNDISRPGRPLYEAVR